MIYFPVSFPLFPHNFKLSFFLTFSCLQLSSIHSLASFPKWGSPASPISPAAGDVSHPRTGLIAFTLIFSVNIIYSSGIFHVMTNTHKITTNPQNMGKLPPTMDAPHSQWRVISTFASRQQRSDILARIYPQVTSLSPPPLQK